MSDGYSTCEQENWQSPLYWKKEDSKWYHFTLNGIKEVDINAPVSNISYFEADAFARWNNKRLPTEFEWEVASNDNIQGNFLEDKIYQPYSKKNGTDLNQHWGHVWEWTSSNFSPYPGFKYHNDEKRSFLRIRPLNFHGAPARGATVTLYTNERTHSKTIDAGSGYLCQMEPVAHYGIRDNENEFKIKIKWTNGDEELFEVENLNQTIVVKQKI